MWCGVLTKSEEGQNAPNEVMAKKHDGSRGGKRQEESGRLDLPGVTMTFSGRKVSVPEPMRHGNVLYHEPSQFKIEDPKPTYLRG